MESLSELDEFKEKLSTEKFLYEFYSSINSELIVSLSDYYEEFFQFLDFTLTLSMYLLLIHFSNLILFLFCFFVKEDSKTQLCETAFLETIISIIEIENVNKELVKYSGLFLTTLLTDGKFLFEVWFIFFSLLLSTLKLDENVNQVIEYKNRFILSKALDWLSSESSDKEKLYLVAAIIIANYTRSGESFYL